MKEIKQEKRALAERVKFLEFQLRSYEEYFPQLEEYRDLIIDERVPLSTSSDNLEELETADPSQLYLSREEWERLSVSERNQLALDRYLERHKSDWEIGRYYERYLGFLRETTGWVVTYHGALRGVEDLGRDLICVRNGMTEIVQAKCWSRTKVLHEKHTTSPSISSTIGRSCQRPGEFYVETVKEAEHRGFRRAWRHHARPAG